MRPADYWDVFSSDAEESKWTISRKIPRHQNRHRRRNLEGARSRHEFRETRGGHGSVPQHDDVGRE